jgi:senataxin
MTLCRLKESCSLSTMNREYAALKALSFYDLFDDILAGKLAKPIRPSLPEVKKIMETQGVNEPQAISILCSLSSKGFSLIQG